MKLGYLTICLALLVVIGCGEKPVEGDNPAAVNARDAEEVAPGRGEARQAIERQGSAAPSAALRGQ